MAPETSTAERAASLPAGLLAVSPIVAVTGAIATYIAMYAVFPKAPAMIVWPVGGLVVCGIAALLGSLPALVTRRRPPAPGRRAGIEATLVVHWLLTALGVLTIGAPPDAPSLAESITGVHLSKPVPLSPILFGAAAVAWAVALALALVDDTSRIAPRRRRAPVVAGSVAALVAIGAVVATFAVTAAPRGDALAEQAAADYAALSARVAEVEVLTGVTTSEIIDGGEGPGAAVGCGDPGSDSTYRFSSAREHRFDGPWTLAEAPGEMAERIADTLRGGGWSDIRVSVDGPMAALVEAKSPEGVELAVRLAEEDQYADGGVIRIMADSACRPGDPGEVPRQG